VLAETVSLDGGALLLGLVIVVLVLAALVGLVTLGFVLADKAGRGSRRALVGWVAVLVVEGLFCLASVVSLLRGELSLLQFVFPAIVACQVATFLTAGGRR